MSTPSELEALKAAVRGELWTSRKSAHEEYDRALLTLAGGGLALSVTLVKDMFPLDKVVKSDWLISSWCFFASAILAVILSFLLSQLVHQMALKRLNANPPLPPPENLSNVIVVLNWIAGAIFIAGVVAMTMFSAYNFNERLKNAQEESKRKKVPGTTAYSNTSGALSATGSCYTSAARSTARSAATTTNPSPKSSAREQSVTPAKVAR